MTHSEYFFANAGMDPSVAYGVLVVGFPVFSSVLAETHSSASSPSLSSFRTSNNARSRPPSAMPTSLATCRAVSAESPVAIMTVCELARSERTTSAVSLRTGHAKAKNPSKTSPRSISSRVRGLR